MPSSYDEGQSFGTEVATLYGDCLLFMDDVLARIGRIPARKAWQGPTDHLKYAACLFASSIYGSGLAILGLYRSGTHRHLTLLLRSQFEAAVKAEYLSRQPVRAIDFFDSEPFERWALAREYPIDSESANQIEASCLEVVRRRPNLLQDPSDLDSVLAKSKPLNYNHVWKQLRFKDMAAGVASVS